MDYNLNDPNLDFDIEQEALINALKGARGDRRVMAPELTGRSWAPGSSALGGIGAALTRAAGGIDESRAMREQRALAGEQQRRIDTLRQELTTPGTRQVESYVGDEGPLPTPKMETAPLSPLDESRRRLDVYSRMSRLPLARQLAEAGIKSEVDMPEKVALRDQQTAAAKELQQQREYERWQADVRRAEDQRERDRQRAEDRKDFIRLSASLRPPPSAGPQIAFVQTVDEKGNPVTQVVDKRSLEPGTQFAKPVAGGGKGGGAQVEKAKLATSELLDKINAAEQGLPHTSGMLRVLPKAATQFLNSEQTKMADSFIGNLSAEQAHELYGAAFTAAEMQRAADFLPTQTDTADTLKSKLKSLRVLAEKKQARLNGEPDPHPKIFNDVIEPAGGAAPTTPAAGGSNKDAEARAWLDANPNDPRAAAVRKKLEGK